MRGAGCRARGTNPARGRRCCTAVELRDLRVVPALDRDDVVQVLDHLGRRTAFELERRVRCVEERIVEVVDQPPDVKAVRVDRGRTDERDERNKGKRARDEVGLRA